MPKKLKIYVYKNCDTCRRALKFLDAHGVDYESFPIRETPPSIRELKRMLEIHDGNLQKLFNASGQDYRKLGMKDRLPSMSVPEVLALLSKNGNLIKRPFILGDKAGAVGFNEADWTAKFTE